MGNSIEFSIWCDSGCFWRLHHYRHVQLQNPEVSSCITRFGLYYSCWNWWPRIRSNSIELPNWYYSRCFWRLPHCRQVQLQNPEVSSCITRVGLYYSCWNWWRGIRSNSIELPSWCDSGCFWRLHHCRHVQSQNPEVSSCITRVGLYYSC